MLTWWIHGSIVVGRSATRENFEDLENQDKSLKEYFLNILYG